MIENRKPALLQMKALIDGNIWSDPDFENLSANAKLIVFWLLTSPSRDNAGVVRVSHKRVAFECSVESPEEILDEAMGSGSFVVHGDRVWIRKWIAKQIGAGDSLVRNNMMKRVQKCIASHPKEVRQEIYKTYPELIPTPSEGGDQPPSKGQGKERKGKGKEIEEFAGALAELYGSTIDKINPESIRAVWDRGITKEESERVLMYVKKHRKGALKDEPLIPTTANRALLGIGDLIDRAFACQIPSKKDFVRKPMPTVPDSPPVSSDELKKIKAKVAALKKKIKEPKKEDE